MQFYFFPRTGIHFLAARLGVLLFLSAKGRGVVSSYHLVAMSIPPDPACPFPPLGLPWLGLVLPPCLRGGFCRISGHSPAPSPSPGARGHGRPPLPGRGLPCRPAAPPSPPPRLAAPRVGHSRRSEAGARGPRLRRRLPAAPKEAEGPAPPPVPRRTAGPPPRAPHLPPRPALLARGQLPSHVAPLSVALSHACASCHARARRPRIPSCPAPSGCAAGASRAGWRGDPGGGLAPASPPAVALPPCAAGPQTSGCSSCSPD
jgi:hypothetical protein